MLFFFEIYIFQLLYWLGYYPGGFNLDAYGQWDQIHGLQQLNNWHPVFTTICYGALIKIHDSLAFCIFIQLILFTAVVSELLVKLVKYGVPRTVIYFVAFVIGINPAIGMNNVCLIKDVPFAISVVCFFNILLEIYCTNGEWLKKQKNIVLLILLIVVSQMIRHNSIFFWMPIIILLFLYKNLKKNILIVAFSSVVILGFVEGPLFDMCKVERHENITGEMVGVPMSIMVNSFLEDPQNTPPDVRFLLLEIAPLDDWKKFYYLGEWDSCKWEFGGTELFKGEKISTILNPTLKTIKKCPGSAYRSLRENTRVVWQVLGENEWKTNVYIEENDYGIVPRNNRKIKELIGIIDHSCDGKHIINVWNIGMYLVLFLFSVCVVYENKRDKELLFLVPTIIYSLCTMLLLAGPSYRYFYFINIIFLPVMLIVIFIKPIREIRTN